MGRAVRARGGYHSVRGTPFLLGDGLQIYETILGTHNLGSDTRAGLGNLLWTTPMT